MYFQSLDLDRRVLFQALGIHLLLTNMALASAFGWQGAFPDGVTRLVVIGIAAGLAGMTLGQRIPTLLSAEQFKGIFFVSLAAVGVFIFLRALLS